MTKKVEYCVLAEQLLQRGSLFVHLNPTDPTVVVPEQFKKQEQLVLQFGYNMAIPIFDIFIDNVGISGTLSFSNTSYKCFVPWSSVFAFIDDEGGGYAWPEKMPLSISKAARQTIKEKSIEKKHELKLVPKNSKLKLPPYIRVIK